MATEGESLRNRVQGAGEQAVGDIANALLANPLFEQALSAAFGAKEKAEGAQRVAMQALDLPSAGTVTRLERRIRLLSDRVEALENELDRVNSDLRALRERATTSPDG